MKRFLLIMPIVLVLGNVYGQGFIHPISVSGGSSITSNDVVTALGFVPANAASSGGIATLNGIGTNTTIYTPLFHGTNNSRYEGGYERLAAGGDIGGGVIGTNYWIWTHNLGVNPFVYYWSFDDVAPGDYNWAALIVDPLHGGLGHSDKSTSEFKMTSGGHIAIAPAYPTVNAYAHIQLGAGNGKGWSYWHNNSNLTANLFGYSGAYAWQATYADGSAVTHDQFPGFYTCNVDNVGNYELRGVGTLQTGSPGSDAWGPSTTSTPWLIANFNSAGALSYANLPGKTLFGDPNNLTFVTDVASSFVVVGDSFHGVNFGIKNGNGSATLAMRVGATDGINYFTNSGGFHFGTIAAAPTGIQLDVTGKSAFSDLTYHTNGLVVKSNTLAAFAGNYANLGPFSGAGLWLSNNVLYAVITNAAATKVTIVLLANGN